MRKGRRAAALLALWAGFGLGMAAGEAAEQVAAAQPATEQPATAAPAATPVYAPPEYGASLEPQRIVVTATRMDMPLQNVPDSVSVMTVGTPGGTPSVAGLSGNLIGDVESRQYRKLTDALKNAPGVSYTEYGGVTSVSIRGMKSYNTRLMVDGMPMDDPSLTQNSAHFATYTFDNMSQMEVMRGPQGTLYGSNAMGGVVAMTSKKGEGPLGGFLSTEAGSFGSFLTRFGASAGTDKADFSLGGSYYRTDGISSAAKMYGNRERDGVDRGNIALRLGANPSDCLRFDLFAHAMNSRTELDGGGGPGADHPYFKVDNDRYMVRPQAVLTLFDGKWEQTAGVGYLRQERKYKSDPYLFLYTDRSRWRGETWKFDYQSVVRLVEWNAILAGVDVVRNSMESQDPHYGAGVQPAFKPDSVTTTGVFLEDRVTIGDVFSASVGVRNEHHGTFGDHATWKSGAIYKLPTQTRLLANVGTGFRAPSLYELYDAWSGNPNLKPEKSFGWDAGFEQSLFCDRVSFGASYFRNRIKDMIDYSFAANKYDQIAGKTKTWGIEAFAAFKITDTLALSGQYTWTRARSEEDHGDLKPQYRIPLNAFTLNLDWTFCEKGVFTAGVRYVGKRWDSLSDVNTWAATTRRMPSYAVARVGASWKFTKNIEVFGRVENLFDKKYEEVYGYGAPGISFFGGATISF